MPLEIKTKFPETMEIHSSRRNIQDRPTGKEKKGPAASDLIIQTQATRPHVTSIPRNNPW
jgi:hypothetical protein